MIEKLKLAISTLYRITKNFILLRFRKNLKLNLGAGGTRIKEYINVDSLFIRETDLLCSLNHLPCFIKNGNVTTIYASHIFEHFTEKELNKILKICFDLLQNNGILRISVPDIDKIVKIYNNNWEHFQTKGNAPWNGLIYGGQSSRFDFHKTGFNFNWLSFLLEQIGFKDIEEYDAKKFTEQNNFQDSSLANAPFNEPISLNIIAKKII